VLSVFSVVYAFPGSKLRSRRLLDPTSRLEALMAAAASNGSANSMLGAAPPVHDDDLTRDIGCIAHQKKEGARDILG